MFKATRLLSWNSSTDALAETVDFYSKLFGATAEGPVTERRSDGTEVTLCRLSLGDLSVGFFTWPEGRRPAWDHHTFEVVSPADPDAVRDALEKQGIPVEGLRRHANDGGYSIVLRDPDGNRVELATTSQER